jgi:MinD-like ATPase involved in chromosome partitioning or flagellar assembly
MSDKGLIVTTSEVPSLTNTYSFIKSGIFRKENKGRPSIIK